MSQYLDLHACLPGERIIYSLVVLFGDALHFSSGDNTCSQPPTKSHIIAASTILREKPIHVLITHIILKNITSKPNLNFKIVVVVKMKVAFIVVKKLVYLVVVLASSTHTINSSRVVVAATEEALFLWRRQKKEDERVQPSSPAPAICTGGIKTEDDLKAIIAAASTDPTIRTDIRLCPGTIKLTGIRIDISSKVINVQCLGDSGTCILDGDNLSQVIYGTRPNALFTGIKFKKWKDN
jgi:hypothetical protein